MIQRGDCLRLLFETPKPLNVGGKRGGQHLERDFASQPCITRSIDLAHASRSDEREDFIRSKFGTRGQGHEVSAL